MLPRTFIFLPGIGETRERQLWAAGVESWTQYRHAPYGSIPGVRPAWQEHHRDMLLDAEVAYDAGDAAFFGPLLGSRDAWRALDVFMEDALYLDIETTGLGRGNDYTTVCGLHSARRGTKLLVHGDDLTAEAVQAELDAAKVIVTFNGASFDLPFLRNDLEIEIPTVPHVDLMLALRRVGLRGGLKRIETQLGLARPDDVQGMDGYQAVLLWQRHLRGDSTALEKLLAYNREDVANMVPLAKEGYRRLVEAALAPDPEDEAPTEPPITDK